MRHEDGGVHVVEADLAKLRKEEEELCQGSPLQRILGGDLDAKNDGDEEKEDDENQEAEARAYEKMFPQSQVGIDVKHNCGPIIP